MQTKEFLQRLTVLGFGTDAAINGADVVDAVNEYLPTLRNAESIDADRDAKYQALQAIGETTAKSLHDMVNAMECDYDRLHELTEMHDTDAGTMTQTDIDELKELQECAGDCESEDDARERIEQDPLEITLGGTWTPGETPEADRAYILLGTGGPATRIVCELRDMQPHRAWLEVQDWFQPWTEYRGQAISRESLLKYCSVFYFGEG